jgi:hypothetical protein
MTDDVHWWHLEAPSRPQSKVPKKLLVATKTSVAATTIPSEPGWETVQFANFVHQTKAQKTDNPAELARMMRIHSAAQIPWVRPKTAFADKFAVVEG